MLYKLIIFSFVFLSTFGYSMSKNILLVTNNGWYLNDKHIQTLVEVNSELNNLSKNQLDLVACSQTEFDSFTKTLDIVHKLKFTILNLDSDFSSIHCN